MTVGWDTGMIKKVCLSWTVVWHTGWTRTRTTTAIKTKEMRTLLFVTVVCFSLNTNELLLFLKTITAEVTVENLLFTTTIRNLPKLRIKILGSTTNNGQCCANKCAVGRKKLPARNLIYIFYNFYRISKTETTEFREWCYKLKMSCNTHEQKLTE